MLNVLLMQLITYTMFEYVEAKIKLVSPENTFILWIWTSAINIQSTFFAAIDACQHLHSVAQQLKHRFLVFATISSSDVIQSARTYTAISVSC